MTVSAVSARSAVPVSACRYRSHCRFIVTGGLSAIYKIIHLTMYKIQISTVGRRPAYSGQFPAAGDAGQRGVSECVC